jgi:Sec-independent protein translocase protein TatA
MIGISEIFLIIIIGIFFLKPKDYNLIIKNLFHSYNEIKKYMTNFKNQVIDIHLNELSKEILPLNQDEIMEIYGKNYIHGEDGKLHEVFSIDKINDEIESIKKL